ncbi:helix-turn-helix domain-containing protein [Cohnella yongneupensis]|uniref:Helix-turn-helix domain-containing protein n=1 Tax=Cohnella yongneupensis TaxID=425006 RepID=A0ABW0R6T1_9BACL
MDTTEFGAYLERTRTMKGISMRHLAKKSGVSQSYISQLEKGSRGVPTTEIVRKLADALEIDFMLLSEKAGHLNKNDWFSDRFAKILEELPPEELLEFYFIAQQKQNNPITSSNDVDLVNILNSAATVFYQGKALAPTDRQRILDMLHLLFPGDR